VKRITLPLILIVAVAAITSVSAEISTPRPIQEQSDAISQLRAKAERGDAEAQVNLAARYANGVGVERDDAQAAAWFRKAAEQGEAQAQFNMGVLCASGRGVPKDASQAAGWFERAAAQGHQGAKDALAGLPPTDRPRSEAAPPAPAGPTAGPMTNADVVALCKAGLSEEVALNAIRTASATHFDLTPVALVNLANAGVPSKVIAGMQNAVSMQAAPAPTSSRQSPGATTPESKYGKNAKYTIEMQPDGFVVRVSYGRYQFIPESSVVAAECRSALTAIAWEYAERLGKQIEPINDQRIVLLMGRNGLKGTTTCTASAPARWK